MKQMKYLIAFLVLICASAQAVDLPMSTGAGGSLTNQTTNVWSGGGESFNDTVNLNGPFNANGTNTLGVTTISGGVGSAFTVNAAQTNTASLTISGGSQSQIGINTNAFTSAELAIACRVSNIAGINISAAFQQNSVNGSNAFTYTDTNGAPIVLITGSGQLSLSQTTNTPVTTNNAKSWMIVTNNGTKWFVPLFQ